MMIVINALHCPRAKRTRRTRLIERGNAGQGKATREPTETGTRRLPAAFPPLFGSGRYTGSREHDAPPSQVNTPSGLMARPRSLTVAGAAQALMRDSRFLNPAVLPVSRLPRPMNLARAPETAFQLAPTDELRRAETSWILHDARPPPKPHPETPYPVRFAVEAARCKPIASGHARTATIPLNINSLIARPRQAGREAGRIQPTRQCPTSHPCIRRYFPA